tara:strand:+ start:614 stop:724 length:111 start_codon:yes stop_codon:yes gene_type:complete
MEILQKLIEENPAIFRVLAIGLGLALGYLFFLVFLS